MRLFLLCMVLWCLTGCQSKELPKHARVLLLDVSYHFDFNRSEDESYPIRKWRYNLTKEDRAYFNALTTDIVKDLNLHFQGGLVPTASMSFPPMLIGTGDRVGHSDTLYTPLPFIKLRQPTSALRASLLKFQEAQYLMTLDIYIIPQETRVIERNALDLFSKMSHSSRFQVKALLEVFSKHGTLYYSNVLESTYIPTEENQFEPHLFQLNIPLLKPHGIMSWDLEKHIKGLLP